MNVLRQDWLLFDAGRALTPDEDRRLARVCLDVLGEFRAAIGNGRAPKSLGERARRALLHLGGDPERSSTILRNYDATRFGPFLGVSDEGSAVKAIREAALQSPKVLALPRGTRPFPLVVGVAIDAERLGAVGEVNVGPQEYADIWLGAVDRILITTNIGTRVNVRLYQREPRIALRGRGSQRLQNALDDVTERFRPFVRTPDRKPRPITVLVEIWRILELPLSDREILGQLVEFVRSGKAAGKRKVPEGQELGLAVHVAREAKGGRKHALEAITLAAKLGMRRVILVGQKLQKADEVVSLPGLLDYFKPEVAAKIYEAAKGKQVEVLPANRADTDTIARTIWVGLTTARGMGANLGKYGCFPLTLAEAEQVVERVQGWLPDWSAAPVLYLDMGLATDDGVYVNGDLVPGIEAWLTMVARHAVRVVLIDTIDKAAGRRLLKTNPNDKVGFLTEAEIARIERHAARHKVRVLWAGGCGPRDVYRMGKLGIFGIYVTSAASRSVAVTAAYAADPTLAALKEPSRKAVLRVKTLLEAGFLTPRVKAPMARTLEARAAALLQALDSQAREDLIEACTRSLAKACISSWRSYWKHSPRATHSAR